MRSKKKYSQRVIILVGLVIAVTSASFYYLPSIKLPTVFVFKPEVSTVPTATYTPDGIELGKTPLPTALPDPDIPGLYESLIAQGLEPVKAAEEYCKKVRITYWCESKVLRTKQFTKYNLDYALDDTTVYIARRSGTDVIYHPFKWVDRKTFIYFESGFFKDKNGFYYDDYEGGLPYPTKTITNIDVPSVSVITKNGTTLIFDKNHVYSGLPRLDKDKFVKLSIVENADPHTLTISTKDGQDFEDKNNYYAREYAEIIITPKNN